MAERKQRSDAQQNRERILMVAKEAFAKSGAGLFLILIEAKGNSPEARVGLI